MKRHSATPYILDFGIGAPVRLELDLPDKTISPFELVPHIYQITDAMITQTCKALALSGNTVQCGPGCGICCNQLVPISEYEAVHIATVVRNMPKGRRSRVINRFNQGIARLDKAGLVSKLAQAYTRDVHDQHKLLDLKKHYWRLAIPCPFLEENSCSIHPHRPVACRQYLVTSAPHQCAALYSSDARHEVVIHPADVGGALASFSGEGLAHSRALPLIFSLLAERGLLSQSPPTLHAHRMMNRFLDLLAIGFSRSN